jgi:hypothetical protein
MMFYRVKLWPDQSLDRYTSVEADSPLQAAEKLYGHLLDSVGSNGQLRVLVQVNGERSARCFYDRTT